VPFHGTWSEFRDIPRNQRERRAELRQRYAGVEVDYEVIPELPARTIRPIAYQYKKKPRNTTKVSCPGWPFDVTDARRRQGKDAQRKIIIGTDNGQPVELTFVRIPAGEFVMGDASGFEDEQPCRVKIEEPYWISSTTITNQQFNLFDPSHDSRYLDRGGKDHSNRGTPLNKPGQPVVRVSWRQAMAYCQWLSSKTRKKFSLPTEAQWEFASRAGSDKANGQGWGISRIPDSVAEWTHSAFLPYPYRANDGRENESATGQKVIRGGSMLNVDRNRQSTLRQSYAAWQVVYNVGFRIICEGEPVSVETTDSVTRR
jgi:formylglycine-generating enzyme required for sulfatase activity